jgi:DNA-binding transcriptional LysR family regulator
MQEYKRKKDTSLLRSLQYFEAVARHQSMKLAARDLGVSQSAVSHQMRELSDTIGQQLLAKSGRGIVLTETGQTLAGKLATAFAGLESLVDELVNQGRGLLQLAVCSSFGPTFLIDRVKDFYATHPEIDLQLRLYAQDPLLINEVADAYITAYPVRSGFVSHRLWDERLLAVRSPSLEGTGLAKQPLITTDLESGSVGQDWVKFCRRAKLRLSDLQDGSFRQCTHYLLALELAKRGQGVALVPDFLAQRDIKSGTLVQFDEMLMPSGRVYSLCYKQSRAHEPKLVALAEWLKNQVG